MTVSEHSIIVVTHRRKLNLGPPRLLAKQLARAANSIQHAQVEWVLASHGGVIALSRMSILHCCSAGRVAERQNPGVCLVIR